MNGRTTTRTGPWRKFVDEVYTPEFAHSAQAVLGTAIVTALAGRTSDAHDSTLQEAIDERRRDRNGGRS